MHIVFEAGRAYLSGLWMHGLAERDSLKQDRPGSDAHAMADADAHTVDDHDTRLELRFPMNVSAVDVADNSRRDLRSERQSYGRKEMHQSACDHHLEAD